MGEPRADPGVDPALPMKDRRVLIVGGRSGIGFSIAQSLGGAGAHVCIASRDTARCDEAAAALRSEGIDAFGWGLDIRDGAQCVTIAEEVNRRWGGLDSLVNSAGGGFVSDVEKVSTRGFDAVLDLNVRGAFAITQAMFPMLSTSRGNVVHIVSPVLDRPMPGLVHVGAAKAALIHLVRGWALEWAQFGIRVNAVAPGVFYTDGARDAIVGDEKYRELVGDIPLGRLGERRELANVVTFLTSEASSYVTGQCIYVDGALFLGRGVSYRKGF